MAALDIRSYLALKDLRRDLLRVADEFCNSHPADVHQPACEPFYFSETLEITVPLPWDAWTLQEFRSGLRPVSHRI